MRGKAIEIKAPAVSCRHLVLVKETVPDMYYAPGVVKTATIVTAMITRQVHIIEIDRPPIVMDPAPIGIRPVPVNGAHAHGKCGM